MNASSNNKSIGISGLAAAYIHHRDASPDARILILDNHDDFGGHAKRNEHRIDGKLWIQIDTPAGEGWIDADLVVRQIDLSEFMDDKRPPVMIAKFVERLRAGEEVADLISKRGLIVALGGVTKLIPHEDLEELLNPPESVEGSLRWGDMDFRSHFDTAVIEPFLATYDSTSQVDPKTPHSRRALIPTECWNFAYLALRGDGREPPWLVWFEYVNGKPRIVGLGVDV